MDSTTPEDVAEDSAEGRTEAHSEDRTSDLVDRLRPALDDLQGRLRSANERVSGVVREHPAACVAGAVALGYLVARLARRERS